MTTSSSSRKEAMFAAGKRLMLSKGYTATTVDEIVAAVGITKGAFYYFFRSKEAYAQELLEYNWRPIRTMQGELANRDLDPLSHLHQHIQFMVDFLPGDGRLMGIISQELGEANAEVGAQVRGYFQEWTRYLQQIIELAKAKYAPDADFTPQSLMEFVLMTIEGVPVVARQLGDAAVDRAVHHLQQHVNTLLHGR